jgi:hypothetical protein
MPRFLPVLAAALLVSGLVTPLPLASQVTPQPGRERIDVSRRGPQVGDTIPDFTLRDQYGAAWTRESILGGNGTMLVFLRSADW